MKEGIMKKLTMKTFIGVQVSVVALLIAPLIVAAQNSTTTNQKPGASLTGKYEGIGKDATGEVKVTLDLVDASGTFSGTVTTHLGVFKIVKGQMADGLLSLELETKGGPHQLS